MHVRRCKLCGIRFPLSSLLNEGVVSCEVEAYGGLTRQTGSTLSGAQTGYRYDKVLTLALPFR